MKNLIEQQRLIVQPMYPEMLQVEHTYSYEVSETQHEVTNDTPIEIIGEISTIKTNGKQTTN
jgi:hypothetical protein